MSNKIIWQSSNQFSALNFEFDLPCYLIQRIHLNGQYLQMMLTKSNNRSKTNTESKSVFHYPNLNRFSMTNYP